MRGSTASSKGLSRPTGIKDDSNRNLREGKVFHCIKEQGVWRHLRIGATRLADRENV